VFFDENIGVCLEKCESNEQCGGVLSCKENVCVMKADEGEKCNQSKGIFCKSGFDCVKPDDSYKSGFCAKSCLNDGDCSGEQKCDESKHICIVGASFGEKCQPVAGKFCSSDLVCLIQDKVSGIGFCTSQCDTIGDMCQTGNANIKAMCMLIKGNVNYCALLCNAFGTVCPDFMSCNSYNFCELK
jgi:hypothetical protein